MTSIVGVFVLIVALGIGIAYLSKAPSASSTRASLGEDLPCATLHSFVPAEPSGKAALSEYFPPNCFPTVVRSLKQKCYGKPLSVMGEEPIWDLPKSSKRFVFRFLWLRTFHHPICVRVERNEDGTTNLYGKELSGTGGYGPGHVIVNQHSAMSDQAHKRLMKELRAHDFFNQPADQNQPGGFDGAQWIFEVSDKGRYHLVDSWSAGGLRDIGILLLKESKLLPKSDVY